LAGHESAVWCRACMSGQCESGTVCECVRVVVSQCPAAAERGLESLFWARCFPVGNPRRVVCSSPREQRAQRYQPAAEGTPVLVAVGLLCHVMGGGKTHKSNATAAVVRRETGADGQERLKTYLLGMDVAALLLDRDLDNTGDWKWLVALEVSELCDRVPVRA